MAVVSRIATIILNGATGNRAFVATAAVQDTAAGSSVVVSVQNSAGGAVPPVTPDTYTLEYRDDSGGVIKTVALSTVSEASQSDTFFFTTNGLTGGTARCGTVEIVLRATRTTGGPTNTYDVETDGAPNTPPTGFTTSGLDRGWIRATTTLVEAVSNVALGGAKSSPAEYDESLFVRTTLGHASYVSRVLAVASSSGGLSGNTNSAASVTRDVSFTNVVDNRFAAAATVVGWTVTASNATLTGLPFTTFTTTTDDTITVDPRLTVAHLLQIDDGSFGTPPLSKNNALGQRRTSSIGYLSSGVRAARGTVVGTAMSRGVNGLSVSTSLQDQAGATTPITQTSEATATKGGETGWVQTLMQWTSALPGGTWNKTTTITAPADIVGAAYLVNSSVAYTLLAIDPALRPVIRLSSSDTENRDHLQVGNTLQAEVWLTNMQTHVDQTIDAAPVVALKRTSGAGANIRRQHWNGTAWVNTGGGATTNFTCTQSAADSLAYYFDVLITEAFGATDFVLIATTVVSGTPYSDLVVVEVVGSENQHDANRLDAVGLALTGGITFK